MKKSVAIGICLVIAVALMGWSLGVASDLFALPVFSSFWWLSYEGAHYLTFSVLSIGGAALLVGVGMWLTRKNDI